MSLISCIIKSLLTIEEDDQALTKEMGPSPVKNYGLTLLEMTAMASMMMDDSIGSLSKSF